MRRFGNPRCSRQGGPDAGLRSVELRRLRRRDLIRSSLARGTPRRVPLSAYSLTSSPDTEYTVAGRSEERELSEAGTDTERKLIEPIAVEADGLR